MSQLLNDDLNVIASSNLEILPLDGDLAIIQKLDDEPNDVQGLTSAQLKAKFDESGLIIQKYINESLIPQILADDATETARAAAEERREEQEVQRERQENLRQQAEGQREANEQARAEETAGIVAQATQQAQLAKGWADAAQKAAGGGNHAQRHAVNAGDPITPAMIGAAPAGYGYGGESLPSVTADSVDELDEVYAARFDEMLAKMPNFSTKQVSGWPPAYQGRGWGLITVSKFSDDYTVIEGRAPYNTVVSGYWRMIKQNGKWYPVEYSDPPMIANTEYRTTQRYMGEPVYVKTINFGALPNNTIKSMAVGVSMTNILSLHGVCNTNSNRYSIPLSYDGQVVELYANFSTVFVRTTNDRSADTAVIIIKYTKSTG